MSRIFDVIKGIHLTEKATIQAEKANTYVFKVNFHATKFEIKEAVSKLMGKTVLKVNTCCYDGKKRQRGQSKPGSDPHWKKAFVKLKEGERLDLV